MRLGLRMGLNSRQGWGSALDPDAKLYIAAVEAVLPGNSITAALPNASNPKRIISDFIKAEKTASRWTLHKRLYLPIYNNSAASSIDMVTTISGEFVNTVTHAAGYVQGNGSNGYFDFKIGQTSLGHSLSSASWFGLCLLAPTSVGLLVSNGGGVSSSSDILQNTSNLTFRHANNTLGQGRVDSAIPIASQNGIIIGSREGGSRRIHQRKTSGFSTLVNTVGADFGSLTNFNINAFRTSDGGGGAYSNGRYGSFGASLGMTETQANGFSANLKTLWESLTGLTLP